MLQPTVAIALVALFIVLSVKTRPAFAITALFLPLVMWVPWNLFWFVEDPTYPYTGTAPAIPGLAAWGVILILGLLVAIVQQTMPRLALTWILPTSYLVAGYALWWPHTNIVASGTLHWLLAIAAWIVGHYCGSRIDLDGTWGLRLAQLFAGIFAIELLMSLFQLATGGGQLGRMTGMYGHPGFLGKVVVICLVALLPLTRSARKETRLWAFVGIATGVAATGLTLSRTNIAAAVLILVVWSLALPRVKSMWTRIGLPILAVLAVLPVWQLVMERFDEDPEGGSRPALLAAGLRVLEDNAAFGVGPNGYVDYAIATEQIVQQLEYPVHNSFILAASELGIVGGVLVALPLLTVLLVAISKLRDPVHMKTDVARAVLIVGGGVFFIGMTGWGLNQTPNLPLLYFLYGFAFAQLMAPTVRAVGERARQKAQRTLS